MGVTIADVAARAGVSKTTVSRVLNSKGEINENTVLKVRKAISELGYVPSAGAVGLARGTTQMIGMLVPDLAWAWAGIVQAVIETLETEGFGLRMLTWNRGEESLRRLGLQVAAKSFDGLLVIEPEGAMGYITELHEAGLPVVLIDDRFQRPGFPYVATTNREGVRRRRGTCSRSGVVVLWWSPVPRCSAVPGNGWAASSTSTRRPGSRSTHAASSAGTSSSKTAGARSRALSRTAWSSTGSSRTTIPRRPARSPPCTRPACRFPRMSPWWASTTSRWPRTPIRH